MEYLFSEDFVQKMVEVQKELEVPKGQFNSFGNFSYRTCDDILKAVKPLLNSRGLLLVMNDKAVCIDGWHYVMAEVAVTNGKDYIAVTGWAREVEHKTKMDDSQVSGMASSYARKYALGAMFGITTEKDADEIEFQPTTQRPIPSSSKQKDELAHAKQRLWAAAKLVYGDNAGQYVKDLQAVDQSYEEQPAWYTAKAIEVEMIANG